LKPDSWAVVNSPKHITPEFNGTVLTLDADGMAQKIKDPKSVNLILLGFALAIVLKRNESQFFCSLEDIKTVLENRMVDKEKWLNTSLTAIETGYDVGLVKFQITNLK
jgi:indolepyruvate ferredoxin oxidoreductase beta subunit